MSKRMSKREWKTTTVDQVDPTDPMPPEGDGWRLVGVAPAIKCTGGDDRRDYYENRIALFWEREIS